MWRCGVADTSGAMYLRPLALPVALCFKTFMGGRVIKRCGWQYGEEDVAVYAAEG